MSRERTAKPPSASDEALRRELEAKNLALTREIAERKQVMALLEYKTELLEEKEQLLRDIIEDQNELICRFTPSGALTFANGAYLAHTGLVDENLPKARFPLLEGDESDKFASALKAMQPGGPPAPHTAPLATSGGREVWIQWQIRALPQGGFQAVGRDITQTRRLRLDLVQTNQKLEAKVLERTREFIRKNEELAAEVRERIKAEGEAKDKEKLLSAILDGIEAAFIILDTATRTVVSLNPAAEKMLGMSTDDLLGRDCCAALDGRFGDSSKAVCSSVTRQSTPEETYLALESGKRIPVYRFSFPVGKQRQAVILFDLTERRNLERQLNVAQKMESIGLLASGIAHEINTPIQFTGDSVRFMQEAFEDLTKVIEAHKAALEEAAQGKDVSKALRDLAELEDDLDCPFIIQEIPRACGRALEGVARVAAIVLAMKNFAHPGSEEKKPVNLAKAITNTVIIAKNEWKYVAEMDLDLPDDLPMVECLPGDMNQVFLNVIVNAAHAVKDVVGDSGRKGTVSISARHEGESVAIRIADTGEGIPPENINRIYDPFFTTKEVGKGTGQGLAIVHDIVVNKHGGTIDVASEPGRGTAFTLTIPVADESEETP